MSLDVLAAKDVILLDAGGTLIGLDYDAVRGAVGPAGARLADEALELAEARARRWADEAIRRRLTPRELWDGYFSRVLSGAGLEPGAIPAALEALWSANRRQGLWRRPLPGVGWALEALHRSGRRLAVVSNAEGQVEADLRAAGLSRWLETVVDSHLVGVAKPDPEIFAIALRRLGVGAEQAFYVGDVPAFDVEGARRAGLPAVLIDPWGVHEDCDAVRIASLAALPALLGGE
ncbi:MAG: HAD-IA family hydrolase [Acidobacteriota bacterium]|nr:HAD-IA family hydrolase [Acidobacteriota bacterium]